MLRTSQHFDKIDFHSYAATGETLSGAKTPLPDSPAKPPSKKGKADDDISSVISTLSQLINTRSETIEKMRDTVSSLFTPSSPNLMGSPVLCSVQWVCVTTDGSLTTVMKNKPGKETVQMQKSGDIPKNLMILETGL
ncbi:hypothetical protein ROHU_030418 [Labeo rohita]|uniref:Uncharacterized protein n=1 Tax=Labeo rohita TaxID=84645 RepID=A0A498M096_LABRO|nr:hypothetical protein ROHU_030418 [Labeo rohita]